MSRASQETFAAQPDPLADGPLIFVAQAVKPGPGGAEADVNSRLLGALASAGKKQLVLIAGGHQGLDEDLGIDFEQVPGWVCHFLGTSGSDHLLRRSSAFLLRLHRRRTHRIWHPLWRAVNRAVYEATGAGLKSFSFERATGDLIRRACETHSETAARPTVWARVLPHSSLGGAVAGLANLRRDRPYLIANLNDPFPPSIWPGQYTLPGQSDHRLERKFARWLQSVDGWTVPCAQLRTLYLQHHPHLAEKPCAILPHLTRDLRVATNQTAEKGKPPSPHERLELAFAGGLRANRCRSEFLEGWKAFRENNPQAAAQFTFSFHLSVASPVANRFIEQLGNLERLTVGVENLALEDELNSAAVGLDLESEADGPLLMTKVARMLGSGKPIFALCAAGGTTDRLTRRARGWSVPLGDSPAVRQAFSGIHEAWSQGRLAQHCPDDELVERFAAARQIADFRLLIEAVAFGEQGLIGASDP